MAVWCPCRAVATIVAGALVVAAAHTSVDAQTVAAEETDSRAQFGGSAGVLFILPTVGVSLTVPLRPNLAVEGAGELLLWTFDEEGATYLPFQVQLRHQFRRGRSRRMHATYGTTFFGKYTHRREWRESRSDGSVLVFPEYRRFEIRPPLALHAGVGGQRPISRRVVARWDVQVLAALAKHAFPVPRATVSVSWQRGSSR
jgi:hypothetical protein